MLLYEEHIYHGRREIADERTDRRSRHTDEYKKSDIRSDLGDGAYRHRDQRLALVAARLKHRVRDRQNAQEERRRREERQKRRGARDRSAVAVEQREDRLGERAQADRARYPDEDRHAKCALHYAVRPLVVPFRPRRRDERNERVREREED